VLPASVPFRQTRIRPPEFSRLGLDELGVVGKAITRKAAEMRVGWAAEGSCEADRHRPDTNASHSPGVRGGSWPSWTDGRCRCKPWVPPTGHSGELNHAGQRPLADGSQPVLLLLFLADHHRPAFLIEIMDRESGPFLRSHAILTDSMEMFGLPWPASVSSSMEVMPITKQDARPCALSWS
jgi:hypothetical protein